jgi:hypothetical protein
LTCFFEFKAAGAQELLRGDAAVVHRIQRSLRIQGAEVRGDELEARRRQLLGLGEENDTGELDLRHHQRSLRM